MQKKTIVVAECVSNWEKVVGCPPSQSRSIEDMPPMHLDGERKHAVQRITSDPAEMGQHWNTHDDKGGPEDKESGQERVNQGFAVEVSRAQW